MSPALRWRISFRAAGWEEVGKTKGFSRVNHARDFYIPNDRPKVLFMKPFRRDAWDLIVSNALTNFAANADCTCH
ncbi:MAG: hypothetical protein II649_09685 [Kiritimatiellae bacterium]|nr:hypothetical protein [Kiritimatiellia bacterium]